MEYQRKDIGEVVKMKNKTKQPKNKEKTMYHEIKSVQNDLFDRCIQKGLIEITPFGYYFTPEFFETLDIYTEE